MNAQNTSSSEPGENVDHIDVVVKVLGVGAALAVIALLIVVAYACLLYAMRDFHIVY